MNDRTAALDAALAREERHGRPGLPDRGFTLGRADGQERRSIRHADGGVVIEPDGHLHRIHPSPDRRRIAVEWAASADENAILGIVDVASGRMQLHRGIRLRYDPVLWAEDSRHLEVVASRDGMLVKLDVDTGEQWQIAVDPAERLRLFPGGRGGLLARSTVAQGTTLTDRATGAMLGRWAALLRAQPLPDGVLVWHGSGIDAVGHDGAPLWSWTDPLLRVIDVAVPPGAVVVLAVADGRTVLIDLVDGVESGRAEAMPSESGALTATAIGVDDGVLRLGIEGPLTPPRITERGAVAAAAASPLGSTARLELAADDGASIAVHLTSPRGIAGPLPLILTCYGGFGIPQLPLYEPTIPAWVAHGGAYATAQLRGGGERGRDWQEAGSGAHKHRAIADLADVARGLIEAGITRPDLLILAGSSLGGVVATSCALRHPELCAGVVSTAAPLDLLALDDHPLGARWRGEFGDDGTTEARERLRDLSPLARAEALDDGAAIPAFLGIVLGEDTRVRAQDTVRMVDAIGRAGGSARLWTASDAGHGANGVAELHGLGLAVLEFAAETTGASAREAAATEAAAMSDGAGR